MEDSDMYEDEEKVCEICGAGETFNLKVRYTNGILVCEDCSLDKDEDEFDEMW
jgi:ribosome-binding protein aMBF1 (putative translation factor)